jgi:predicted phage terminase large subunit-like protein
MTVADKIRASRVNKLKHGTWTGVEIARLSPLGLAVVANNGKWESPPHMRLLSEKLMEVASGKITRLLVELHPRAGKSELVSHYFPAWYLGHYPDRRVVLAGYDSPFAVNWSRSVRDVLIKHGQQMFQIRVTDKNGPAEWWRIDGHRGYMVAAGVGGGLTGKGGALAIIDDPVKSAEDVRSQLMRDRVWDWYRSHLYPRLEKPGGAIVLVMSRWHEDDLAGRLLREMAHGGEHWEELRIPAIAEDDPEEPDPLGRAPGEAMWPQRFGIEDLQRIRRAVDEYWFQALYQGRPRGQEGAQFARSGVRYFTSDGESFLLQLENGQTATVPDSQCARFATVDLAISERQTADYTAIAVCALLPGHGLAVLDVQRARVKPGTHVEWITQEMIDWDVPWVAIESVQFQADVVARARRAGLVAEKLTAKGDKMVRAQTAIKMWNAGQVFLPANATWAGDFVDEALGFPVGAHDDQVDCLAYACLEAARLAPDQTIIQPVEIGRASPWTTGRVADTAVLPRVVR